MIIQKEIETTIDIHDPINLYADDSNLLAIIIGAFGRRCSFNCWISDIVKIVKQSECTIVKDGRPDLATMSVIFLANAVVFARGEVINGCKVISKQKDGSLLCETSNALISMDHHESINSIVVGQFISVRVRECTYNTNSNKIIVNAIPFIPLKYQTAFQILPGKIEKSECESVFNKIKNELALQTNLKKENEKAWAFYTNIVYAYKEKQNPPPGADVIDITTLCNSMESHVNHYVCRDNRLYLNTPSAYIYKSNILPENYQTQTNIQPTTVLLILLEDYYNNLKLIREMATIYKGIEESNLNLWKIFNFYKFKPVKDI